MTLLVIATLGIGVALVFADGWRDHLSFGSEHVVGTVVSKEETGDRCGSGRYSTRPEQRYELRTEDGVLSVDGCGLPVVEVGDRIEGWVTDDGQTFPWPTWQFYVFVTIVTAVLGVGLTWLTRRRPTRAPAADAV